MEGMQRKKPCHKGALPESVCHATENQKEQEGVGYMEEDIDQMMPPRPQSEYLTVQHVRKPCQRVPVMGMRFGKGPGYAL